MRKYIYNFVNLLLFFAFVNSANAQRRIGLISDIHPGFTSLSVSSGSPIKAAGIGVSLMKWRSDNKFVTTSVHYISSTFSNETTYDNELYGVEEKSTALSLEFVWSKLFKNMEADDPFVMYRNIGLGILQSNYTQIGISPDGKTIIEDFRGSNYSSTNIQFLFGLGSEFRVANNIYAHVEMNLHLDEFAIGFVPRVGLYYRLY